MAEQHGETTTGDGPRNGVMRDVVYTVHGEQFRSPGHYARSRMGELLAFGESIRGVDWEVGACVALHYVLSPLLFGFHYLEGVLDMQDETSGEPKPVEYKPRSLARVVKPLAQLVVPWTIRELQLDPAPSYDATTDVAQTEPPQSEHDRAVDHVRRLRQKPLSRPSSRVSAKTLQERTAANWGPH